MWQESRHIIPCLVSCLIFWNEEIAICDVDIAGASFVIRISPIVYVRGIQEKKLLGPFVCVCIRSVVYCMFVFIHARLCTQVFESSTLWCHLKPWMRWLRVLGGADPGGGLPMLLIETLPIRVSRRGLCVIWLTHTEITACVFDIAKFD